jgi:hypothetical protein
MPLQESPQSAANIATFGGVAHAAAILNYSVPLPGSYRGSRVIELANLGIAAGDWSAEATGAATAPRARRADGTIDRELAVHEFSRLAIGGGIRGDRVAAFFKEQPEGLPDPRMAMSAAGAGPRVMPVGAPGDIGLTPDPDGSGGLAPAWDKYLAGLAGGVLARPYLTADHVVGTYSGANPQPAQTTPTLFLIEEYMVSSFATDYGLGKTVRTVTLLPGEQMDINLRTWRSSTQREQQGSSIFDSVSQASTAKFSGQVQQQSSNRSLTVNDLSWHAEASVSGGFLGFVSASVSGGGGGSLHAERESFASTMSNAIDEHAQEASSAREASVTSNSEMESTAGSEETTSRVIRNVNMRRTLNFVFRELNQRFDTYTHLVGVKVAFSNGTAGSWVETPVSGLRGFLRRLLNAPAMADAVASAIVGEISAIFDVNDAPVQALETVAFGTDANGPRWSAPAAPAPQQDAAGNWIYPPPTANTFYRFRRGPLSVRPDGHAPVPYPVDGVVIALSEVVLRTDSVVVEALLGQADALDEYAMASQKADAEAKSLVNDRTRLVNAALDALPLDASRVDAFATAEDATHDDTFRVALDNH